ncbi:MAG TPA: type II toxin-antitoxin system VapC family toxin [Chloroflexota bacterium]|jgi:predicted nucleic acid-binding protein
MPTGDEFFVDANIIIYSATPGPHREACFEILDAIAAGGASGRTSPSALEEVWHIELSGRAGNLNGLTRHAFALFTPLLAVTDEAFRLAFGLQARSALGANDRLHVGTCLAYGIRTIVSADAAFDGIPTISRVDPLDAAARQQLLDN